jgi:hypothetical protein
MFLRIIFLVVFLLIELTVYPLNTILAQEEAPRGIIRGKLRDSDTRTPLSGADVVVLNTILGAAADLEGNFIITGVPVGNYTLQFSYLGYEPLIQTDVIVRSKRITFVEAALRVSAVESKVVEVTGGYFVKNDEQPVSITTFSREEIRRAPGSMGDVSRIIMSLPAVAKVDDQTNNLIVRGGSPLENSFYVDNIEIPNINHFPTQGASGGPIGLLNVDFIRDVDFHAGGFPVMYGDRLSSIMKINFREGNRSEFDGQLDLNFAGFGAVAEGPLFHGKGSWLVSARRSYLDLLVKAIDVGTSIAPRFGDFQGKLSYDLHPNHKLRILAIGADDHSRSDQEAAVENDMIYYGNQDITQTTAGMDWQALWSQNGYSNTSISYSASRYKEDFFETGIDKQILKNRSLEQTFTLRNVNYLRLNQHHSLQFGGDAKHLIAGYDNFYAENIDALGNPVPALIMDEQLSTNKFALFADYVFKASARLTINLGLRGDYFSYNQNGYLSPRFSFSCQLTEKTALNGSTGLYTQNLPLVLLAQNPANRKLKDPRAIHFVASLEHLITENTRFTLEVYQKNYQNFPLDPNQPGLFLIDEIYYQYGFFYSHDRLMDNGKASSRGIEVMIQKKLAKDFYGLASASYFRTRYQGYDGTWYNRIFDNRVLFSIEGGYKPNSKWEFSLRWIYAGGHPYTPFDMEASTAINRGVFDVNHINTARYPDYHSLNVRFDRRFHFSGSNLIFYFSIWNVYNRKNVASYYWNEAENQPDTIYQWGLLPIFGLEYEF